MSGLLNRRELMMSLYAKTESTIRAFVRDESGATAIEYALIASGVAVAIIAAVNSLGTKISTKFTSISTSLK